MKLQCEYAGEVQKGSSRPGGTSPARTKASQLAAPTAAASASTAEHRFECLALAAPGVPVLADVGVETQQSHLVVLRDALTAQIVHRHDRRLYGVGASERERLATKVGGRCELAGSPHEQRVELDVGIAHREDAARAIGRSVHTDVREVGVPRDIDPIAEQSLDLRFIVREQHEIHLDRRAPEVLADALPDRDDLGVIRDRSDHKSLGHPDHPSSGIPARARPVSS